MDRGLKNYFPINNLIIGYVRGFGYLLALLVLRVEIEMKHIWFAIAVAFYIFGSINSKDINDVEGDKAMNRQTLPIILENRSNLLSFFAAPFIFIPAIVFPLSVWFGIFPAIYLLLLAIIPLDFVIVYFINKSAKADRFENNIAWIFMIITYLSHHIIFIFILILL
ncbi:MAG: UbiA prenyltransferase family protein [Candidatus Heimdallarchaeota archaeon]|nr:UbiA prenyltransferase family protein [Candidatus Heimdallarchaeota archaeon]